MSAGEGGGGERGGGGSSSKVVKGNLLTFLVILFFVDIYYTLFLEDMRVYLSLVCSVYFVFSLFVF